MKRKIFIIILYLSLFLGLIPDKSVKANLLDLQKVKPGGKEMTQNFQVRLSMNQAAIVKSGLVLKQGDFGMNLEIEVLNFDTSNTTPQIVFRKPMGAVESTSVTKSGNVYTYTLRGTELDTPGKVICDLKLKNSTTQRISTASFSFEVAADTLDGLAEQASSYSDTIEQIVGSFENEMTNLTNIVMNSNPLKKLQNLSWTFGKGINGSGVWFDANTWAMTAIDSVSAGYIIKSESSEKDGDDVDLHFWVHEYNGSTWIRRTELGNGESLVVPDGTNKLFIVFGRSTAMGIAITQNDINTYFSAYGTESIDEIVTEINASIGAERTARESADALLQTEFDQGFEYNAILKEAEMTVTGDSVWKNKQIVKSAERNTKYYFQIGTVTNCATETCATIEVLKNDSSYTFVTLSTSEVSSHTVKTVTTPNEPGTYKLRIRLYRNYSDTSVAYGTTTFENILVTKSIDTENILIKGVSKIGDYIYSVFEMIDEIHMSRFCKDSIVIDSASIKPTLVPYTWVNQLYCIYFDRDVYVESINPSFTVSNVEVTYNLRKASTDSIVDGASSTSLATYTGMSNSAVEVKRIVHKNEFFLVYGSGTYINTGDTRYNSGIFDYAPKICYRNNGILENVTDWNYSRIVGQFVVKETLDFADEYFNPLFGKKIVWFGTSIPEGGYAGDKRTAYPNIVGRKLGAAVFNEAVGSSAVTTRDATLISEDNPYGYQADFTYSAKTFTDTLEMKEWLIAHWEDEYWERQRYSTMTDAQKNEIRSWSYERKLDKYLTEDTFPDIFVFDHGYNDPKENQAHHNYDELVPTYGDKNLYSYQGGMNYLLNRIFAYNKNAKVIMIGHYTENADSVAVQLYTMQSAVSERWQIELVRYADQLGWSGETITTTYHWVDGYWVEGATEQSITIKNANVCDTIHPNTDLSGTATNKIADAIVAKFKTISD